MEILIIYTPLGRSKQSPSVYASRLASAIIWLQNMGSAVWAVSVILWSFFFLLFL